MSGITYSGVNDALNAELLGGRFAGRPLYLVLDRQAREGMAARLGVDEESVEEACCRAVGRTLWPQGNPYWRHSKELRAWHMAGRTPPPPFTGLLFALSHAAERMASDDQFSSGNYYQRLADLLRAPVEKLRGAGIHTLEFWQALSTWLAQTNYAHGRPTARQIPGRQYVSLAISQAIVRAADRSDFHSLFEKYGFTGADAVSGEVMARYLAAWIHGTGAGPRLKAAWAQSDLRPRIAEVALAELESWAELGDVERCRDGHAGAATRLSLVASLGGFPRRRLSLSLGRKAEGGDALQLQQAGGGAALELGNSLFGAFATLSPTAAIDIPSVLRRGLEASAADGSIRHEWRPRFVIPFVRSPSGPFWTEASRGIVGAEHLVLVLDAAGTRQEVDKLLAATAVPGYTCATSAELPGVPPGWVLYEGVRLVRALDEVGDKAADLSPIADAGGLRIEGGMRLAPGIWHRRAPPSVRLDGARPGARLELRDGVDECGELVAEAISVNGWALLDLAAIDLPESGELFARAVTGKGHDHAESLLVRSARRPRPLDRQGRDLVATWTLDGGPEPAGGELERPVARGVVATGPAVALVDPSSLSSWPPIGPGGDAPEAPGELPALQAGEPLRPRLSWEQVEEARRLPCGERGFHWYAVETVPPGAPKATPVAMSCEGCGHTVLREGGASRPPATVAGAASRHAPPPSPPPPAAQPPREGRVDMDLLLDALSFMGSGSWGAFEALVADLVDQPWEATAIASDLSSLGHLDLRRRPGSGQVVAWSVAPPALATTPGGRAFLAGFRNAPMVEALAGRAEAAGGRLAVEALPGQPARVAIDGLDAPVLQAMVAGLLDPHGRELLVVPGAAARLASTCLAMPGAWSLLEPATLGVDKDLEGFDLSTNRWRAVDAPSRPGAYRTRSSGTRYFVRDAAGTAVRAPHELAKLLAARQAGARLHAHDSGSSEFLSVLGCEPPGLLARALVACSGALPVARGGHLHHAGVPPSVAASVLAVLYPEPQ